MGACPPGSPGHFLPQEAGELQGQFCAVFGIPLPIFLHDLPWPASESIYGLPVGCLLALLPLPQGCHAAEPLGGGIPVWVLCCFIYWDAAGMDV